MDFHENLLADRNLGLAAGVCMGQLLAELLSSLSSTEASIAGLESVGDGLWPSDRIRQALETRLDAGLLSRLHAILEWHTENRGCPIADSVLVRHDFGSHNFTFDRKSGLPCGLFDFEAICWNDRHCDFNLLPSYGDEIMMKTIETHSRLAGTTISVNKVRLHLAVYALSNVAWRTEVFDLSSNEVTSGLKWVAQALVGASDGV